MIPPFEKMRTSPFDTVVVDEVHITSRYNDSYELDLMARVIGSMPMAMRSKIQSIFCDSKVTHGYTVEMRPGCDAPDITGAIGEALAQLFKQYAGGHNHILVHPRTIIAPDWAD